MAWADTNLLRQLQERYEQEGLEEYWVQEQADLSAALAAIELALPRDPKGV